jgi:hypothetical protein
VLQERVAADFHPRVLRRFDDVVAEDDRSGDVPVDDARRRGGRRKSEAGEHHRDEQSPSGHCRSVIREVSEENALPICNTDASLPVPPMLC